MGDWPSVDRQPGHRRYLTLGIAGSRITSGSFNSQSSQINMGKIPYMTSRAHVNPAESNLLTAPCVIGSPNSGASLSDASSDEKGELAAERWTFGANQLFSHPPAMPLILAPYRRTCMVASRAQGELPGRVVCQSRPLG